MSYLRSESPRGKRLIHEGRVLARRLRRLVKSEGGEPRGPDTDAEILNHTLGLDIIGLVAMRVQLGNVAATLICAPGYYFSDKAPHRRLPVDWLASERRSDGRRTIIVSKHELIGKVPFDLSRALMTSPPAARRNAAHALVATGRRSPDAIRPSPTIAMRDALGEQGGQTSTSAADAS